MGPWWSSSTPRRSCTTTSSTSPDAAPRARAAVHSRWGNDITVLLGDYLYIKSMALALTQDSLDVIRLLCDVTLRMIEGELFQLTKNGDIDITLEEHFDIIRRKTAHLFGGCARIGGMLGNTTREAAGSALGVRLQSRGLPFQLVDDLLDYTADESALGKPIGSDLREGKVTLPIINLLERGGEPARTLVGDIIREKTVSREQWNELRRLLAEHHATTGGPASGASLRRAGPAASGDLPAVRRARRAHGASGLHPVARSLRASARAGRWPDSRDR